MASDHVLALSHIAVFGAGLMTIALLSRGLAHTKRSRGPFRRHTAARGPCV